MIPVEVAQQRILGQIRPVGSERVGLTEALGRVLCQAVCSDQLHPSFDNSAMDGFAVAWRDVQTVSSGAPCRLPVSLEVPAGVAPGQLVAGSAARVMTGAPIPSGADTVVMREDCDESERGGVTVNALPQKGKGAHIRRAGTYIAVGQQVLSAAQVL